MAVHSTPQDLTPRGARELVRELLEPSARSRERVLQSIQRLRELADAKARRRR